MELDKKKLLIVDDDGDFLWILRQGFEGQNLSVSYATDGAEGFEKAEKEKPDLILADIKMPNMDGISMAKKIREKGNSSKIIFLSAFSDPKLISEALNSIIETDYIIKSDVHIDEIVKRVKDKLGI